MLTALVTNEREQETIFGLESEESLAYKEAALSSGDDKVFNSAIELDTRLKKNLENTTRIVEIHAYAIAGTGAVLYATPLTLVCNE